MAAKSRKNTKAKSRTRRSITGAHLPMETETCRFIFASALDLFLTFLLLYFSSRGMMRNVVVESNPVARYFVDKWSTQGLVYFKFGMVALIVIIAQIVYRRRPATAKLLLNGATLVVGAVVAYSLLLLLRNRL